ncbi:MAG: DUF3320 domain-containing protein [Elusimicrobia bacterium]|nr:DUF3320 domain-containing protein [Elusimicrobiota bacterium]
MPSPELDTVRERLEAARTNLLDMTLRNRLINFRAPKSRGVQIVNEDPSEIFRILVSEGKPMTFVGKPGKENEPNVLQKDLIPPPAVPEDSEQPVVGISEVVDATDLKLNTNETASALSNRLLKTWRDAQSSMEEQGVNILFLALGMLEWYEADASQELIKSPLVLIPVLMERTRGNKFQVKYDDGAEIGGNLSLTAKLAQQFRIKIPEVPGPDDLDVKTYFAQVVDAVSPQKRWRVDESSIVLGFFSYAKYLMFNDLEGIQWPEKFKPWDHPVLGALLDSGFDDDDAGISEGEDLDKHRPVENVHEVVDADGSQVLALLEARSGRSMVIEGPPGTGKSQTITNLIAEAIGEGKKVLFVAEKRAALEVVWRNLERVGLHEACLELHSNKTHKKTFYAKLKETIDLGMPQAERAEAQLQRLMETREKLNAYCQAVHQAIPNRGISPIQAMGRLVALGEEKEGLRKPDFSIIGAWTNERFNQHLELAERIQSKVKAIGRPMENPFYDSQLDLLLPDDKLALISMVKAAREKIRAGQGAARILASRLSLPDPKGLLEAEMVCRAADKAAIAPVLEGISVSLETWRKNAASMRGTLLSGKRYSQIQESLRDSLKPEAWDTDLKGDRDALKRFGNKWWRFFVGVYWKTRVKVAGLHHQGKLPKGDNQRLAVVEAVLEFQSKRSDINRGHTLCQQFYGAQWHGEKSDWGLLITIQDWIIGVQEEVCGKSIPMELLKFLEGRYDRKGLAEESLEAANKCKSVRNDWDAVLSFLKAGERLKSLVSVSFAEQLSRLSVWLTDLSPLEELVSFNHLANEARTQGLESIVQIAIEWPEAGDRLLEVFKRVWYSGVLREACEQRPQLASFDRQDHESLVDAFRRLDRLMLEFNRAKILLRHWQGVPRGQAGGSLGILQRQFELKRSHMTIRNVMAKAGEAIQAIKPVFMMSPISIAMYLPSDGPKFDLVVFDEASQIKPEDAFCAIIRGRQAIVVGDSKQMPPTSFFDKMIQDEDVADDEGEANVTRNIESILGMMSSKLAPSSPSRRDLRWHYRSRHESLIASSNRLFYKERLVIFPTPERRPDGMGLQFNFHPETIYDRGGSKKNRDEARIVARDVLRHVKESPLLSLGVVAFSQSQQEAIQDEVELLRTQDPAFNEFDKQHPTEPLFVKNLETVQGDERDVIFISIGYGRDKDGFVSMNFGPINKDGGERRLNVLITRAKVRCELFSNIRARDFRVSETQALGVHSLRTFIHFAETGELDIPTPTGREPMSPFEEAVIERLRAHGYKVEPQVGSAGFFVDIGVCDPQNPDTYVLGVECDGAKYHSARSARDRDRLRQFVLEEGRGWRIHRIWSTDWWRNQEREMKRLLAAIDQAIAVKGQRVDRREPVLGAPGNVSRKTSNEHGRNPSSIPYKVCGIRIPLDGAELRDVEPQRMSEWVWKVVEIESPIHFDEIVRRIREASGMERAGDAARDAIKRGIRPLKDQGKILVEKEFLWKSPKHPPQVRNRGEFPGHLKKLELIHPDEVKVAIIEAVKRSFGIAKGEVGSAALTLLGFERVTGLMSQQTERILHELISEGKITEHNGVLKLGILQG